MIHHQFPTQYRGSVKEVIGPLPRPEGTAAIFRFTDAFSVFDWGRMPDSLGGKGQALTVIAAHWFERLAKAETWKNFSKSPEALALRKGSRFGAAFNEIGEELQAQGLLTHYIGVLSDTQAAPHPHSLNEMQAPPNLLMVKQVSVVRPTAATVLGRPLADYQPTRTAPAPRLIPLEVVFRFGCPSGSSLIERAARDPEYLASLGFAGLKVEEGAKWDFPVLELFTKLESTDRPVTMHEALAISGISATQLQDVLLRTAWVAGALKWLCSLVGLELADGKLEWALTESGQSMLVDAMGPDELRLLFLGLVGGATGADRKPGVQLSKEFLRSFYRKSPWYDTIQKAKQQAKMSGKSDWKKMVSEAPPKLSPEMLALATQLYQALANHMTARPWFPDAWPLDRVIAQVDQIQ